MKYCKKCLFPDTKPDICFNEEGVCDACLSAERKENIERGIDWDARAKEFSEIIEKYRSKDGMRYDCLVPVSGGKDSTFQAYCMKVVHKMNPLAVTFDQFDKTEISKHNLEVLKNIGVDHINFTLNPNIQKKLIKKGLEIAGDPYWVNHVGIFTVPIKIAVALKIPLVIWGENSILEYGGPEADRGRKVFDKRFRQEYCGMRSLREEDMVDDEIKMSDLKYFVYPTDEEIKEAGGMMGLFYGSFFKWDSVKNVELCKTLGWKPLPEPWPGSLVPWENCDMEFEDVREHMKWIKFGYGRATDQANMCLRSGLLTREEGRKLVIENDGKFSQEHKTKFCKFIGISESEFDQIRDGFVNTSIFQRDQNGEWKLKYPVV